MISQHCQLGYWGCWLCRQESPKMAAFRVSQAAIEMLDLLQSPGPLDDKVVLSRQFLRELRSLTKLNASLPFPPQK